MGSDHGHSPSPAAHADQGATSPLKSDLLETKPALVLETEPALVDRANIFKKPLRHRHFSDFRGRPPLLFFSLLSNNIFNSLSRRWNRGWFSLAISRS